MFRFIHAADIHLDSPLLGLERYEGAPVDQLRSAPRQALVNLVDSAIKHEVDFVLIAGDIFDGDWKDYQTGLFFVKEMARLRQAEIPVVLIQGNHDAQGRIVSDLRLPENVTRLNVNKPETILLDKLGVAIHGQGFKTAAVTENLASAYPQALPGLFNIGLLHTSLSGYEGHHAYAPCSLNDLLEKGYDYWALGHIHQGSVVHEEPWIVFPGNIQGRHAKETGEKGCMLVTVNENQVHLETIPLHVLQWEHLQVDVEGITDTGELIAAVIDAVEEIRKKFSKLTLALRLTLHGQTKMHAEVQRDFDYWMAEIRAAATDAGAGQVWVEKIRFETEFPLSKENLLQREDALGELFRGLYEMEVEPEAFDVLVQQAVQGIDAKLRPMLKTQGLEQPEDGESEHRELIEQARQLVMASLLKAGGAQ